MRKKNRQRKRGKNAIQAHSTVITTVVNIFLTFILLKIEIASAYLSYYYDIAMWCLPAAAAAAAKAPNYLHEFVCALLYATGIIFAILKW